MKWQTVVLALIVAFAGYEAWINIEKAHRSGMAKLAAEKAEIAKISSTDPRTWSTKLIGKPDSYLFGLGLTNYSKIPAGQQFGMPGVARVVQDRTGKFIWLVISSGNGITWMSHPLKEIPASENKPHTARPAATRQRAFFISLAFYE